jgi:hypothetical protein
MASFGQRSSRYALRVLTLLALLVSSVSAGLAAATSPTDTPAQALQAGAHKVYLPLSIKSSAATTPPPATPTTPPTTPPGGNGGIFLDRSVKTASASTAVDSNGGIHTAYVHYVPEVEKPAAVYSYCAGAACNNPASWRGVEMLDKAREVQLALTPNGQPRLLITTTSEVYNGGKDYHYAACDANCAEPSQWSVTRVTSSWGTEIFDTMNDRVPQRSFAIDPQGRPAFIFQDRNYFYREPDHYGAFYMSCAANCTNAENWTETEVGRFINYDAEVFKEPSLTFTSSGQPRVISNVFAKDEQGKEAPSGLYYYECNSGCDQTANWQRTFLIPTGGGSFPNPGWDIELDANNRPRVVIFTGSGLSPETFDRQLLYLWCDTSCLNADNWQFNNTGLKYAQGEAPDLALNAQGQPRIAWIDASGDLGYAWCNTTCESDTPQWQAKIIDTEDALRKEFPQAVPSHCDADVWEGYAPVLALDRSGNPRIAYDVPVSARCLYDDPTDNQPPYHRFMPIWRSARLVYFAQP